MTGLLMNQGIKSEELTKLEVKNVNLREGTIEIMGSRKSNRRVMELEAHQIMDMHKYVMEVRKQILRITKQETTQLFIGNSHLIKQLKKINPRVENVRQIRASVITKWLKVHNLRRVQYMAGHRYISSTEKYKENEIDGLIEEVNQFHPLG